MKTIDSVHGNVVSNAGESVRRATGRASERFETAEFVLPGHPDKLCDAVADTIVEHFAQGDPRAQCGIEVACVFDRVFVTGRIASSSAKSRKVFEATRDTLVRGAYASAGYGVDAAGRPWGPLPTSLKIDWALCFGGFAENERELRHLSDDQAICVGYALRSPETDYLPPAHWLARRIGRELARLRLDRGAGQIGPDGKVIVHGARTGRGGAFRPELVSVSLNHHEQSDWLLLRRVVEEAVETACAGRALPEIEMNGAGMFVAGGPNGDNGLSGKKLVVDAYGPGVPIGGGAWSGKDFFKVDRLGGMAARRLALESLAASDADEALVTLTYLPGGDRPARVDLLLDGKPSDRIVVPAGFGPLESRVLHGLFAPASARAIELARWGHQQPGMPWELEPSPSSGPGGEAIPTRDASPADAA
jgi:S-adenosylmethionine synthetase